MERDKNALAIKFHIHTTIEKENNEDDNDNRILVKQKKAKQQNRNGNKPSVGRWNDIIRPRRPTEHQSRVPAPTMDESLVDIAVNASSDVSSLADKSRGTIDFFHTPPTTMPTVRGSHYEDWSTIDWLSDQARDRLRHQIITQQKKESAWKRFLALHDALSGWFCVLLIAVNIGIIAAIVDIGAIWLANIKTGICLPAFYLSREQCCWTASNQTYDKYQHVLCDNWYTWANLIRIDNGTTTEYIVDYIAYVFFGLIFATLCAILVKTFAPYACGSGVPEVKTILSGFIIRGYLGVWTLLIKSLGMVLGTSANLLLGKEGPFVHSSCCCGNIFARLFPKYGQNEAKKREILSAAAAAGVSVAFGAPIGGVLFSLEEVSYYFPLKTLWRSFFCAMIASLIVKILSPFENQHLGLFYVGNRYRWFYFEMVPFFLLGVLGGLFGALFIKLNLAWCRIRKKTRLGRYPVLEVILVALVTLLVSYPNPFTRMSMSDLIRRLISSCETEDESLLCNYQRNTTSAYEKNESAKPLYGVWLSVGLLCSALVTQTSLFILTFGIKVPCGLFIPSMTLGAITGRIVGILFETLVYYQPNFFLFAAECSTAGEQCVVPGFYAVIGACAFLGGVTRMTVSLVVIMVELTGGLSYSVPLMCAALVSKFVGDALVGQGIYDAHIQLNNYPYLDVKAEFVDQTTAVTVLETKQDKNELIMLPRDSLTVGELINIIHTYKYNGYPVVSSREEASIIGFVLRRDLQLVLEQRAVINVQSSLNTQISFSRITHQSNSIHIYRLLNRSPATITLDTPTTTIIDMCRKLGAQTILVTNEKGHLAGILTKKDIIAYISKSRLFPFYCCSQTNLNEQYGQENNHVPSQDAAAATRLEILKQILSRRSLYDPAFGDSWSDSFRKRNLFDPAYSDWSNSFKRSNQQAQQ
ncbi:unnamed protein product [Adineta ricciae]|uniref:Chloride channel protein n=1 Tax=Adineta ricciae TaxID=249248 RepID=A0A814BBE5_ADIRI|nr:unnamed protein product [Adineta ricciae]